MSLPIELPDGWSWESDTNQGVIIRGIGANGLHGFCTVSDRVRGYELGITPVRVGKDYSGRNWRRKLYEDAVATLQSALS